MRYFGTDGIRGIAYEVLNESLLIKVGKALSLIDCDLVLIGYDTRESNKDLLSFIAYGALSINKKVIDVGIISTPGLAYNSIVENCIGIMITASHNPYYDNGVKIFYKGYKIDDQLERKIEDYIDTLKDEFIEKNVIIKSDEKYKNRYVKFLKDKLEYSPLNIGLDLANGATSFIASQVFKDKVKNVKIIANAPNGKNINEKVGSTHLNSIISLVKDNALDIGLSFDGDGDRLLVVDDKANVYTGDYILYVFAKYLKEKGQLKNDTVVMTIMSNKGIIESFLKKKINVKLTTVGDKNILEEMINNNYVVGAESSGHIINLLHLPTGDGMLSAINLLNILSYYNLSLNELCKDIVIYPEKQINIKVKDKNIVNDEKIVSKINKIKEKYDGINLILRASGTENVIRLYCCYKESSVVNEVIDTLKDTISLY